MSHYSHYRGRSIGRILHFIHTYIKSRVADHCTIGNVIKYGTETVATIEWVGHDLPVFEFTEQYEAATRNQADMMFDALMDAERWYTHTPPGDGLTYLGEIEWRQAFSHHKHARDIWLDLKEFKVILVGPDGTDKVNYFGLGRDGNHPAEVEVEQRVKQYLFASRFVREHGNSPMLNHPFEKVQLNRKGSDNVA